MSELQNIADDPIPASVDAAYRPIVAAVGSDSFYKDVAAVLTHVVPVDRFYLFDGHRGADSLEPLVSETEEDKPTVTDATYGNHFLPSDPLQDAIAAARVDGALVRLRVRPSEISVPSYRQMLERAGVIERVSFVGMHGRGWRCMTLVRRGDAGPFDEGELAWLGGFYRLLTPLVDRHRELVGEVVEGRAERLQELEQRFGNRFPELTPRERQICARAAIGISIEGTALDLGIGSSSVLTYRKRAYQRLGVSSAYELARLVMR